MRLFGSTSNSKERQTKCRVGVAVRALDLALNDEVFRAPDKGTDNLVKITAPINLLQREYLEQRELLVTRKGVDHIKGSYSAHIVMEEKINGDMQYFGALPKKNTTESSMKEVPIHLPKGLGQLSIELSAMFGDMDVKSDKKMNTPTWTIDAGELSDEGKQALKDFSSKWEQENPQYTYSEKNCLLFARDAIVNLVEKGHVHVGIGDESQNAYKKLTADNVPRWSLELMGECLKEIGLKSAHGSELSKALHSSSRYR